MANERKAERDADSERLRVVSENWRASLRDILDSNECAIVTTLGVDAQLANPSPTTLRYDGQVLEVRIKDDGATRDLTYDTQYREVGTTFPVATSASKTLYLFFRRNSADSKWDLIHVAQEA